MNLVPFRLLHETTTRLAGQELENRQGTGKRQGRADVAFLRAPVRRHHTPAVSLCLSLLEDSQEGEAGMRGDGRQGAQRISCPCMFMPANDPPGLEHELQIGDVENS